jgi:MFS transporter, FHS family, glucose/mannose:H+ symporter
MPPRTTASRFESMPAAPFYFGLVLCGLATCLLGPILPVLSAKWSLSDTQGGWLFAAQFAASTVGAIVSSYAPRRSIVLGFAALATGLTVLAAGHYRVALAAFALIGVGLGAAVAATNLIFGTEYPERRGSLLTGVNLFWGAGAVLAPELVALAVRANAVRLMLVLLAVCAVLTSGAFTAFLRRRDAEPESTAAHSDAKITAASFVLFSAMLFLYVGAETAIAGWIATYAHRLSGLNVEQASLFVAAFWVSVVVGRVIVVGLLRVLSEPAVLLGGLTIAMTGVAALLFPHAPKTAFAAVVIAGLGFAPLFPLSVARMLARTGRSRHTGWIFAICGAGGAVVPWIMGVVSQYSGGLRGAFFVPLTALAGIGVCALLEGIMGRSETSFSQ